MTETTKNYEEINAKIRSREACVLTAEEMVALVETEGAAYAADHVDVVTTGTFGCMCSSGAFFNIGQPDPPIKMETVEIDGVPAYHGNAAADFYLGVTQATQKMEQPAARDQHQIEYPSRAFGGGHVLEKLVGGGQVQLNASAYGTDCYPRTQLRARLTLQDFNQAIMLNPRNAYQRYVCAVNTSNKSIYTYMGKLLPKARNATFGGVGTLSPLLNDPGYQTIGTGTKILLGGGPGYVIGNGTQHSPKNGFGNIMVKGDLKLMSPEFIAGASIKNYGNSCFIGLGIPIPILNEDLARSCGTPDREIWTTVVDYSTGTRDRPTLREVNYAELKSYHLHLDNRRIPLSPTSSLAKSRKICNILKIWVSKNKFTLNRPLENLSDTTEFKNMPSEAVQ